MKKWSKSEIELAISLLKDGKRYLEISKILNRSKKGVQCKLERIGEPYLKYNPYKEKICLQCEEIIIGNGKLFCSHSCSAIYNNKSRKKPRYCINCNKEIKKGNKKSCNHKCDKEYKKKLIFKKIENGDITLHHKQYKKYLIEKYGEKCMKCGWNERNEYSGKIPIEIEHIDGNSSNNSLDNLELLCPNCHSLTPTYKALNTGNGRHYRRERFKKGKSY